MGEERYETTITNELIDGNTDLIFDIFCTFNSQDEGQYKNRELYNVLNFSFCKELTYYVLSYLLLTSTLPIIDGNQYTKINIYVFGSVFEVEFCFIY